MRKIFLFSFLLIAFTASSKYYATPLHTMILKADLGLFGTISSVSDSQFVLQIESVVIEKFNQKKITINKFNNWTCAHRWDDYEVGQKVFLFLKKERHNWKTLSGGNEGECPILGDDIFIRGTSLSNGNYNSDIGFHNIGGKKAFFGGKVNFNSFLEAVKSIRSAYLYKSTTNSRKGRIVRTCTKDIVEDLKRRNEFTKWIVDQCEGDTAN